MATTGTKVPSIFNIPSNLSPELKQFAESIKEAVEVRLGRRGDPKDRSVTLRELIDSGLAKELLDNPFDPNAGAGVTDFAPAVIISSIIPPTPTGFSASAAYSSFILSWDSPQFNGLAYTEIWRHTSDDVPSATRVDTTRATIWSEEVGYAQTYFYWIRHVTTSDVLGPFSSSDTGTTAADIGAVMTTLSETLAGLPGYSVLTDADTAHGTNITAIQNDAGAAYVLQVNSGDGEVAGMVIESSAYGAADNSGSAIQFRADKFAIWNATGSDAGSGAVAPFIVDSGTVYIDTVRIKDASIAAAKIGTVNADTITTGTLAAARIAAASLDANKITVNTLNVAGLAVDGFMGAVLSAQGSKTFTNTASSGGSTSYHSPEPVTDAITLTIPPTATAATKSFLIRLSAVPYGTINTAQAVYSHISSTVTTLTGYLVGTLNRIGVQIGFATSSGLAWNASPFYESSTLQAAYAIALDFSIQAIPITIAHKFSVTTATDGNTVVYWTARGSVTGIDWKELTRKQLQIWGAKYTELRLNKPNYDIFICDKAINSRDFFND